MFHEATEEIDVVAVPLTIDLLFFQHGDAAPEALQFLEKADPTTESGCPSALSATTPPWGVTAGRPPWQAWNSPDSVDGGLRAFRAGQAFLRRQPTAGIAGGRRAARARHRVRLPRARPSPLRRGHLRPGRPRHLDGGRSRPGRAHPSPSRISTSPLRGGARLPVGRAGVREWPSR